MSRVKNQHHDAIVTPYLTSQELRLALVDLVDNREKIKRYDLIELESVVSTTAYFLKKERERRDAKLIDECIEGAPV